MSSNKTVKVYIEPTENGVHGSSALYKIGDKYQLVDDRLTLDCETAISCNLIILSDDEIGESDGSWLLDTRYGKKACNRNNSIKKYHAAIKKMVAHYPTSIITALPLISHEDLQWWIDAGCPESVEIEMENMQANHASGLQLSGHPLMDLSIQQNFEPKIKFGHVVFAKEKKIVNIEGGLQDIVYGGGNNTCETCGEGYNNGQLHHCLGKRQIPFSKETEVPKDIWDIAADKDMSALERLAYIKGRIDERTAQTEVCTEYNYDHLWAFPKDIQEAAIAHAEPLRSGDNTPKERMHAAKDYALGMLRGRAVVSTDMLSKYEHLFEGCEPLSYQGKVDYLKKMHGIDVTNEEKTKTQEPRRDIGLLAYNSAMDEVLAKRLPLMQRDHYRNGYYKGYKDCEEKYANAFQLFCEWTQENGWRYVTMGSCWINSDTSLVDAKTTKQLYEIWQTKK